MITKFKIFEEKNWNDDIGSYVIVKSKNHSEFFENNIGRITKMYYPGAWFDVEYDNEPIVITNYLDGKAGHFNIADILIKSKDKTECEAYLAAKKYNI